MLPIIPKVKKLQQKKISSFGGIDRRSGAKENSFSRLCGVDNSDRMNLETGNSFRCAQIDFDIESDDALALDNEEGGKDIYSIGPGGFYKNGKLLPFRVTHNSANTDWLKTHFPTVGGLKEDGSSEWLGDYASTKLVKFNNYIFALPQMIYTDGTYTFLWNKLTSFKISDAKVTALRNGELNIAFDAAGEKQVTFDKFKKGDKLELFIGTKKIKGSFKIITFESKLVVIEAIKENGELYTDDELGVQKAEGTLVITICNAGVPEFVDADCAYNRIWGVGGKKVYASKLGDPFVFDEGDGIEADAWWAETDGSEEFTAIVPLNGRLVAFKRNAAYEIYGTVNPYTIKQVSSSIGCICTKSLREVNGVLFLLTSEGLSVYGGAKFVNINEQLCSKETFVQGIGRGSKYYALSKEGVMKYDYYSGLWTNVTDMPLVAVVELDFEIFGLTEDGRLLQITGDKKDFLSYIDDVEREWLIESVSIGEGDFYAEGINRLEFRFESESRGSVKVEIARDNGEFEACGETHVSSGWQIFSLPVSFKPCSVFKYRISGTGKLKLRLISYSYRKGGGADCYE